MNDHGSEARQFDILVKNTRPVSVFRDAAFMRDLQGLITSTSAESNAPSSVCRTLSPSSLNISPSSSLTEEKSGARRRSRVIPWWLGAYAAPPARAYRAPAEWRDTSDLLRVHYLHLALKAFGQTHSFTVNLRPDIEQKARQGRNECDWLFRRISREIGYALGRKVQFFIVLEETPNGSRRLHIHGEIQCVVDETVAVRKALRRAGGEWDHVRQHQAHTDEDPDEGWAGYAAKDFWKFGSHVRRWTSCAGPLTGTRIKGRVYSATDELGRAAVQIYLRHRRIVRRLTLSKQRSSRA